MCGSWGVRNHRTQKGNICRNPANTNRDNRHRYIRDREKSSFPSTEPPSLPRPTLRSEQHMQDQHHVLGQPEEPAIRPPRGYVKPNGRDGRTQADRSATRQAGKQASWQKAGSYCARTYVVFENRKHRKTHGLPPRGELLPPWWAWYKQRPIASRQARTNEQPRSRGDLSGSLPRDACPQSPRVSSARKDSGLSGQSVKPTKNKNDGKTWK